MRTLLSALLAGLLLHATTALPAPAGDGQTRPPANDQQLRFWLENMVWHHGYSAAEICQVTGLTPEQLAARLTEFGITAANRPARPADRLLLLPYPGGRHPRIGFLDGAIEPQRETKLSAFCPWDQTSYAVLDFPEALWSNLGLTYLAHTHIDTVWTKQGIRLEQLEWTPGPDNSWIMERRLPNGILIGTEAIPQRDHIQLTMWLHNGSDQPLSDLRVQNCVMLKAAAGFSQQNNDNKLIRGNYAAARSESGNRWIITAWEPLHRAWANAPCPCLHSDPQFPDCAPGETRFLRGWFSFHEGEDIQRELDRIEATGWKSRPLQHPTANVTGTICDAATGDLLPARLYIQRLDDPQQPYFFASSVNPAATTVVYNRQVPGTQSQERHVALTADAFQVHLPGGRYRATAMRGKEYLPAAIDFTVPEDATAASPGSSDAATTLPPGRLSVPSAARVELRLPLQRFISMADRGWFSGDVHLHRSMAEIPTLLLAEDLNLGLPMNYWVRDSLEIPAASGPALDPAPIHVSPQHVILPMNTEYEIFSVAGQRQTQGAVFVLNHREPLKLSAPPVSAVAEEARRQGALLDIDKHSWEWSLMIIPVMNVDLFELANNHHWQTGFAFPKWTLNNAPDWPEIERTDAGFTELGWTEFGMRTYYALLNCGYRLRVSAGTGSGVHPVAPGHGRVYVHTGAEFSSEAWLKHLNAGHSFVTTGPLPDLRFNDQLPGSTWNTAQAAETVRITGTIFSQHPLQRLELVRNGSVESIPLQSERLPAGHWQTALNYKTELQASGWLAVRCFEQLSGGKVSFAHSNPIFLDNPQKPVLPKRREVEYLVQRMDAELQRNASVLSAEALEEFRRAREIYAAKLRDAENRDPNTD
ncbi:MAG: hypothetical protein RLZZ436_327 [Planctomycetota bacterium]